MQALLMTGPELTTAATERLPLVVVVPSFEAGASERACPSAPAPFLFGASIGESPRVGADSHRATCNL